MARRPTDQQGQQGARGGGAQDEGGGGATDAFGGAGQGGSGQGAQSFMNMFEQFGRQLRLPSVDVEQILEHHRKNLEALQRSATASAAGATSLMNKQREVLQEQAREFTELAQSYRSPGNAGELMNKQTEFARRAFESAVKNATEMASIIQKSGTETAEILRERMRESMDEIRSSLDKRA